MQRMKLKKSEGDGRKEKIFENKGSCLMQSTMSQHSAEGDFVIFSAQVPNMLLSCTETCEANTLKHIKRMFKYLSGISIAGAGHVK